MHAPLRKSQSFQVTDSVPNSNNTHIHILKRAFRFPQQPVLPKLAPEHHPANPEGEDMLCRLFRN